MEEQFYNAIKRNQRRLAEEILRQWDLQLQWRSPSDGGWTSLHLASALGKKFLVICTQINHEFIGRPESEGT